MILNLFLQINTIVFLCCLPLVIVVEYMMCKLLGKYFGASNGSIIGRMKLLFFLLVISICPIINIIYIFTSFVLLSNFSKIENEFDKKFGKSK